MSEVQDQIDRLNGNIADTYAVAEALGAAMPATLNSDYLAETVADVSAVLYKAQTLTDSQKAQARTNIGAANYISPVISGSASYTVTADAIGKTLRYTSGSTDYVTNFVADETIPVGAGFEIIHQWSKSSKLVFSNGAYVMLEGGSGYLTDYTITLPTGFYSVSLKKIVGDSSGTDYWFVKIKNPTLVKLWENASLSSLFAAQTISVNISGYDMLLVLGYRQGQYPNLPTIPAFLPKTYATTHMMSVSYIGSQVYVSQRSVKANFESNTVTFGAAAQNGTSDNSFSTPYMILGVKGVS